MRPSNDFLTIKEAVVYFDKTRSLFYLLHKKDKEKGRTDRFKLVENTLYVHKDYKNIHIYKEKEESYWRLYYKVRDCFSNEYQMAKEFAKRCDLPLHKIYQIIRRSNITNEDILDTFIPLLKRYLDENKI